MRPHLPYAFRRAKVHSRLATIWSATITILHPFASSFIQTLATEHTFMIQVRKSHERGHANHGWLDTYHTFSFADYHDPEHMHYGNLRVINEDVVAPGAGFGTHPHRDMEIITYVLEGALEHKDSMGSHGVIKPGDVQRMSAGTGVLHSEYNASQSEKVHLLQIWIFPEKKGIESSYEQRNFSPASGWQLLVTPSPKNGEVKIHQDAQLFRAILKDGEQVEMPIDSKRHGYLQVARGVVKLGDQELRAGDGAAFTQEDARIIAQSDSEVLLLDLA
jgi:quercetin 2,3-dioxygenase